MPGMTKATVLLTAHSDKALPDLKPACAAAAAPTGPQYPAWREAAHENAQRH
jgi:ATP-binding protein involved in chromosome partitioning